MKPPSFYFSLDDFVGYFVPGTVTILAVIAFLAATPLADELCKIELNASTIIIGGIVAYFVGVVTSSFTFFLDKKFYKWIKDQDPRSVMPLKTYGDDVKRIFDDLFGKVDKWGDEHFFLTRSYVREMAPASAASANRQNALRGFRRNSIVPLVLIVITEVVWICKIYCDVDAKNDRVLALLFLIALLILSIFAIKLNFVVGLHRNRKREAREVFTGFLAAHKILHPEKNFNKVKKDEKAEG